MNEPVIDSDNTSASRFGFQSIKKIARFASVIFFISGCYLFVTLNRQQQIVFEVESLGGQIIYDLDDWYKPPMWIQALESVFGDFPAYDVVLGIIIISPEFTDEKMKLLGDIQHLGDVYIASDKVTDAGLKHLSGLEEIEFLTIYSNQITDDGLVNFAGMKNLFQLSLHSTRIKGSGIKHLQDAERLTWLQLHCPNMIDEGMVYLAKIPSLGTLNVSGSQISDISLKALLDLQQLQFLCIEKTNLSDNAIEKIILERPHIEIYSCPLTRKPPSYLPPHVALADEVENEGE